MFTLFLKGFFRLDLKKKQERKKRVPPGHLGETFIPENTKLIIRYI